MKRLEGLARFLEREYESAARSLREVHDSEAETAAFPIQMPGDGQLIESPQSGVQKRSGNVTAGGMPPWSSTGKLRTVTNWLILFRLSAAHSIDVERPEQMVNWLLSRIPVPNSRIPTRKIRDEAGRARPQRGELRQGRSAPPNECVRHNPCVSQAARRRRIMIGGDWRAAHVKIGLLLALTAMTGAGQTFEVASVKVATSGYNGFRGGCHGIDLATRRGANEAPAPLGRCVITDARLSHLIAIAYGVSLQDMNTGPDWIQRGDLRFDVNAKAEDAAKTTQKELLTMLQNLLVERFHLKFHYQSSEVNGFWLTVAKGGPKLRQSTSTEAKAQFTGPKGESMPKPGGERALSLTARKYSMGMLADLLTGVGGSGPGVDKTGLTGEYDFTLSWDNDQGPVLATALHQQLGLQMKSEKVSVSRFVVDSAEKPAGN